MSVLSIDWSEVQQKREVYSLIDCDFGKSSLSWNNLDEGRSSNNADAEKFELVLNWPAYTDLKKWYFVEVFDSVWSLISQGEYVIVSIDPVKNIKGVVDNVFIWLNPRDGDTY